MTRTATRPSTPRRPWRIPAALLATIGLLATSLVSASASPVVVQWTAGQYISPPGQTAGNPVVTASGDGRSLAAAWRTTAANGQIRAAFSDDGGSTWQSADAALCGTSDTISTPDIASADDGKTVVAVWSQTAGSDSTVHAALSSDGGKSWNAAQQLSGSADGEYPRVDMSSDGSRIVVVWVEVATSGARIRATIGTTGGQTWTTAAQPLSAAYQDAKAPLIVASDDGTRQFAAWIRSDGSHDRIEVATSATGGSAWSPAAPISAPGQHASAPDIAASSDGGRLFAAWRRSDGTNQRIETARSPDGGASWNAPVLPLSAPGQDAYSPRIVSSADGSRVAALWYRSFGTYDRVQARASSDGGTTWSTPRNLSPEGLGASTVDLAGSDDGQRLVAAWQRSDGATMRIEAIASADGGDTWESRQYLSAEGGTAYAPNVVNARTGIRPTVVWMRNDGTTFRAQAATGSLKTTPAAPSGVTASAGDGEVFVQWVPPTDDGNSPVTGYTATTSPGGQGCITSGTSCTITGLTNGTAYTVSVTATNAIGTGPASTPSPAVTPRAVVTPTSPVPVVTPKRTTTIAKPVAKRSKLKVRIKPNLGPKKQWKFTVKKRIKKKWRVLRTKRNEVKVYKTRGPKHIRVLNLKKGRYKARSRSARGYLYDYSKVVKLRK